MRRKGQQAENGKTERVIGLGRRTRDEIAKWNQMKALGFQTGGRHQTSPASLRGNKSRNKSFGGLNREVISYGVDTTQFKVSSSDHVHYMSSHGQVHVKRYSKVFG